MTPLTENEAYAGLLCSHLRGMVHRLRLLSPEQWDWTPAVAAPTARILAAHAWQWLICDRQHIVEPDARKHPLVPDAPADPGALCDALAAETDRWEALILSLTPAQLDEPRRQFNDGSMNVRGFLCHMIQNCIYKNGQFATLFFALGLDGAAPYDAPFPNPFYRHLHDLMKARRMIDQCFLLLFPVWLCLLFVGAALAGPPDAAPPAAVTAPGARLQTLADGFAFTEGPACDARGNVFFTDQPNDRICEWSIQGRLTTFLQPCGRANGLCFDTQGNLWACADAQNQLWRITPAKRITVVVKDLGGKLLNGPNDVWVRPGGGLYLTDPYYARDYWHRGPQEQPGEYVLFLSPDHKTLRIAASDLNKPNGIIGTPDGKTLYVADIGASRTYAYAIQPDGSLSGKRLFCRMGSDGVTLDDAGNVYLTGHGVTVFDKTGRQIEHIAVDEPWTGNVCFGGADRRTLFITATHGLYAIRTRTHGVGSQ